MIMHVSLYFSIISISYYQWIYSASLSNALLPIQAHNTQVLKYTQYTLPKRALFRYICGTSELTPLYFPSSRMSNKSAIYEQDLGLYFNDLQKYRSRCVTFFILATL